jgi:hypothetical protein
MLDRYLWRDVAALLEQSGSRTGGHSMGCRVGSRHRRAGRIAGLVLIDGSRVGTATGRGGEKRAQALAATDTSWPAKFFARMPTRLSESTRAGAAPAEKHSSPHGRVGCAPWTRRWTAIRAVDGDPSQYRPLNLPGKHAMDRLVRTRPGARNPRHGPLPAGSAER